MKVGVSPNAQCVMKREFTYCWREGFGIGNRRVFNKNGNHT